MDQSTGARRRFIATAGAASGAALGFPAIVKAQTTALRFQSTWPAKDIFHEYANDFAKKVNDMTGGERKIEVLPAGAVVADRDDSDAVAGGENLDHPRARGRGRLGEDVRERPEDDPFDGAFQGAGAVARVVADAGEEIDDAPIDVDLEASPRDPAAEEDGANFALRQLSDVGPIERIEDDDPAEPVDELRPEELPYRLPDPVLRRRRLGPDETESPRRRLPRPQIAREDDH